MTVAEDRQQAAAPGMQAVRLGDIWRRNLGLLGAAALFGTFVNLLALTGPVFMLQVYDRVLGSGSQETLLALMLLVVLLFALLGVLDHARGRLMARLAARLRVAVEGRVFDAELDRAAFAPGAAACTAGQGLRDLDAVQRLLGAPVLLALFDLPFAPLFLAAIFVFHPALGGLAFAGGAALIALAALNQALTRAPARAEAGAADAAARLAAAFRAQAPAIRGLGMTEAVRAHWRDRRNRALAAATAAGDLSGAFAATIRAARLMLQSGMLGLGAWLALRGEVSAGAMVACSILLGRALAPVEQVVAQWGLLRQGLDGARALGPLLAQTADRPRPLSLPPPAARLEVENLTLILPGGRQATLRAVSFTVAPGQAVGVIGPSGAGKTSLARALSGTWPELSGRIRLGGVPIDQYAPDRLGRLIGYLPQRAALFEGTIAENIARLDPQADDGAIVAAAKAAGAHQMIVGLLDGYATRLGADGAPLSGGQVQRIALARALYGDPVLLVLDEPDAHLDGDGAAALDGAIRAAKAAGKAVVVMAHRPGAIRDCERLVMLDAGQVRAFGPRDAVLRQTVVNHATLRRAATPGGAA